MTRLSGNLLPCMLPTSSKATSSHPLEDKACLDSVRWGREHQRWIWWCYQQLELLSWTKNGHLIPKQYQNPNSISDTNNTNTNTTNTNNGNMKPNTKNIRTAALANAKLFSMQSEQLRAIIWMQIFLLMQQLYSGKRFLPYSNKNHIQTKKESSAAQ